MQSEHVSNIHWEALREVHVRIPSRPSVPSELTTISGTTTISGSIAVAVDATENPLSCGIWFTGPLTPAGFLLSVLALFFWKSKTTRLPNISPTVSHQVYLNAGSFEVLDDIIKVPLLTQLRALKVYMDSFTWLGRNTSWPRPCLPSLCTY